MSYYYYYGPSKLKKYGIPVAILIAVVVFVAMVVYSNKVIVKQNIFTIEVGTPVDYADIISCNKGDNATIHLASGYINTLKPGSYELEYKIVYYSNTQDFTANLELVDTTPPELTVVTTEVPWMSNPKLLDDDYITVTDYGDDKPKVEIIDGEVDAAKGGEYEVTYQMTDRSGNSATQKVTYTVNENLPKNCSEHERELYAMLQGDWSGSTTSDTMNGYISHDIRHMLRFDGNHYLYKNTNDIVYTGTYTINEFITPTHVDEGDNVLFCVTLSEYIKDPPRLFCYGSGTNIGLSDKYANMNWFDRHTGFGKVYSKIPEFNKEIQSPAPAIGMREKDVLHSSWGEPKCKNILENDIRTLEQWCYSRTKYICFENGVVTEIVE